MANLATKNTFIAYVSEISFVHALAIPSFVNEEFSESYFARAQKILPLRAVKKQLNRSKLLSNFFLSWLRAKNLGNIREAWWTGQQNSLERIIKAKPKPITNPTDVLLRIGKKNDFLGVSLKSYAGNRTLAVKNIGLGSISRDLQLPWQQQVEDREKIIRDALSLPLGTRQRKLYLRESDTVRARLLTKQYGSYILKELRDNFLELYKSRDLRQDILEYYLNCVNDIDPPFIDLIFRGSLSKPKLEVIEHGPDDPLIKIIKNEKLILRPVSNYSIICSVCNKDLLIVRFKYTSEKIASSIKISVELL